MSRFRPGDPGGPGRPRGSVSGRTAALHTLDRVLGEEQNLARLGEAFRRELEQDPLRFWRTIVMPLLPKQAKLDLGTDTEDEAIARCHQMVQELARKLHGADAAQERTNRTPEKGGARPLAVDRCGT